MEPWGAMYHRFGCLEVPIGPQKRHFGILEPKTLFRLKIENNKKGASFSQTMQVVFGGNKGFASF